MKDKKKMLGEVRAELLRFLHKLDEAIADSDDNRFHSTKFAACKRSALDLKMELTKITQSSKYLYD